MTTPLVRRSLSPYAGLRRAPHVMLRRLLDAVPADAPESGAGSLVDRLEQRIAELLGTPRALFFPSGTMAQQVALRIHAERTGRRTFTAHRRNHLDGWEHRGYAVVHGLRYHPAGEAHRLLTTDDLAAVTEPLAALLIELPQRELGGVLPSWDELTAQVALARERGAAVHLDGARLWEAQPFYDRPHAEIAALFDSVYVSLYKGLESMRGAVLAGPADFVDEAAVWRTRLGGAITDAWPLAAGGLLGLDEVLGRMAEFRDHAVAIARAITADGAIRVLPDPPQSAMFHAYLPVSAVAAAAAARSLLAERGDEVFSRARPLEFADRCVVEVTVGVNALEFTPEEVADLFREVLTRALR
jgi:threonine aldolase